MPGSGEVWITPRGVRQNIVYFPMKWACHSLTNKSIYLRIPNMERIPQIPCFDHGPYVFGGDGLRKLKRPCSEYFISEIVIPKYSEL